MACRYDTGYPYDFYEIKCAPQVKRHELTECRLLQVESVQKTVQPTDKLCEKYTHYADGSAKTEVADAIRQGEGLP